MRPTGSPHDHRLPLGTGLGRRGGLKHAFIIWPPRTRMFYFYRTETLSARFATAIGDLASADLSALRFTANGKDRRLAVRT